MRKRRKYSIRTWILLRRGSSERMIKKEKKEKNESEKENGKRENTVEKNRIWEIN